MTPDEDKKLVIIGGDSPDKDEKPEDSGSSSLEDTPIPTIKPALRFFKEHNIRTNDGRKFKIMADAVTHEVVSVVAEGQAADTVVGKSPDGKEHDFPVVFNFVLYVNGQRMEKEHVERMGEGGEEYAALLAAASHNRVTDVSFCADLAELYDRQAVPWEAKAIIDAKKQAEEMGKPKQPPLAKATESDLKDIEKRAEFEERAKGMNRSQRRKLLKELALNLKHPPR